MRAVKEQAYAKINLYLDVVSRRDDGFHEIKTVMHTVSLCDEITVILNSVGKRSIRLSIDGGRRLPTDAKNIAYAAATLFLDTIGVDADVTVKLKKRIPVAAGLAGGSADAAATLRALNRLFGRVLGERRLLELAAELGSDVPFCLIGGTQLCEGRGERMTRLPDRMDLSVVVAVAGEHVSTPAAYSALDRTYSDFDGSVDTDSGDRLGVLLDGIARGELSKEPLYNIFESVVLPECPGALSIRERLIDLGATHAMMSGSGPSVFGVFKSDADAQRACKELSAQGITAFAAKSTKY